MLKRSRSIEEIYEEAKDYDLVITNDAPLATALNKLVDKPRFDYFAMTPRQIAGKFALLHYSRLYSKAELVLEITKRSGKPLKFIHQSIEKIFDVWNNTGLLESCIQFLTKEESELMKYLAGLATTELAMENFDEEFYENKNIAVAGEELFNLLDKQVLPKRKQYPAGIDLFKDEENEIERTYLFSSANEMLNQTIDLITPENEDEVAIVLNTNSEYLDVLKSRLHSKGITLQIKTYLSENIRTLEILSLIDSSFALSDLKLKDVLFLEKLFDISLNRRFNQYYFSNYVELRLKDMALKSIYALMEEIRDITYGKFFETLIKNFGVKPKDELVKLVDTLDLTDKKIEQENFNLLNYFIKHINIELDRTDNGVLFVNALNSSFIDRQVIFFIGLDESWCKRNPDKPYLDKAAEEKMNLDKFQILLSQGDNRYFFTINHKNAEAVRPCYYFNILEDRDISDFENGFFKPITARFGESHAGTNNSREKIEIKEVPEDELTISPTRFKTFMTCPKMYSYETMMPQEDSTYFRKGNLLHAFAEFYFHHPEYAKENFDMILKRLLDEYRVFVKDGYMEIEETAFTIGMNAIINFIDSRNFKKDPSGKKSEEELNLLFKMSEREKIFSNTEHKFENPESGVKGKMDLISEKTIVDFKTGKNRKKESELLKEYKEGILKEYEYKDLNYQTVAYIAGSRENMNGEMIEFIYFQLLSNLRDVIRGIEKVNPETQVKYLPVTFKEHITSEKYFNENSSDFLKKIGYENYKKILGGKCESTNFFDRDSLKKVIEDEFYDLAINKLGIRYEDFGTRQDNTFRDKVIKKSLKHLYETRTGTKGTAIIFKDDIDDFIKLVKDKLSEINKYKKTNFPNEPIFNLRTVCKECDYLNICIGNKLWSADEGEGESEY